MTKPTHVSDYEEICNSLSMTEIIRLQSLLSLALRQRFERKMALVFSDIVASANYFSTFGDEAGRRLQQRHFDILQQAMAGQDGRIVDTAGDGAFLCFSSVDHAVSSTLDFLRRNSAENSQREWDDQLAVRIGIHHGSVLTDGALVTGEAVNLCARATASANPGEIRLTREAFRACADVDYRLKCRPQPPMTLKGIREPVEMFVLDWRDGNRFPTHVRLETGEEFRLPDQDVISFGRLRDGDGRRGNDVVLQCAEEESTKRISRWHFELRRGADGFMIRALANGSTEVNGQQVSRGVELPLRSGDRVRVGDVLAMEFLTPEAALDQPTIRHRL